MEDVSEQVEGVEEVLEPVLEPVVEPPEQVIEQPERVIEQPEQVIEPPEQVIEPPTPARPRVRKVRVSAPTDTPVSSPPDPNYWSSRLQEHRSNQRLAKTERYGNLRIM